ncbi:MAG: hypothetical protein ACREMB_02025 [Candidatus Rokuibacteriota bacterium]
MGGRTRLTDRLAVAGGLFGLALSLGLHVATLAGAGVTPGRVGAVTLHAGSVAAFWYVAGRIATGGLGGVSGLLRIRRMVPIPFRLAMGAATLNAAVAAALVAGGQAAPDRAWSAYWCMMYLLVAIAAGFVLPRLPVAPARPAG